MRLLCEIKGAGMKLHNIRFLLALITLVLSFASLAALFFIEVPQGNKEMLTMLLGIVVGWSGAVVQHYFGDPDKLERMK